jgi:hypothetical protein
MEKQLIKEKIFEKYYDGYYQFIPYSDFPKDLKETDLIEIEKEHAYYGSDSGHDAFTSLTIYRERLQTDEEFEKSKRLLNKRLEESKKERHKTYLKLKEEFEEDAKV